MKIKITYLSVNVTQCMRIVDQAMYNRYQYLNALIPKIDAEKKVKDWMELNDLEKGELIIEQQTLKWIGELHKEGKLCTTESPIFKAYLTGDGVLRLPLSQGGNHLVITKLIQ